VGQRDTCTGVGAKNQRKVKRTFDCAAASNMTEANYSPQRTLL